MPNMTPNTIVFDNVTAVEATGGTDVVDYDPQHPMLVKDVEVVVVDAVVATDTTAAVVAVDAIISGAARAEKGTITIPDASAIGTTIALTEDDTSFEPFMVDEGDTLFIEHKTAGADAGTETGEYIVMIHYVQWPDGQL